MRLSDLLRYNDIAVQCHDFPDADTIASGFAIYEYLRKNGKKPFLFYSGPKEMSKANMLIMKEQLAIPVEYVTELNHVPELLVTVDCTYGESNVRHFDAQTVAVIDHHICKRTPPALSEVRSEYGSCSSLVNKLYEAEDLCINDDKNVATALYYGLYMDTNGFAEIGHPADKDLRDFADFDHTLITLLQNSNLSSDEMLIAANALKCCDYLTEFNIAAVHTEPCDPNLLGFISDLVLQVDSVDSCTVFCRTAVGYKLSVRSCTPKINAAELAGFITEGVGNGGGHAGKAGGFINGEALGDTNAEEHIISRMISYQRDTDILYAGKQHISTINMKLYEKRDIVLGYVPSVKVMPAGKKMLIRMLEADLSVVSGEENYIMVGISGEVYPIKKDVFEKRYIPCDELPSFDYAYPPSVIDAENSTSTPLAPFISGCRAVSSTSIMASSLTKPTKIFTLWDTDGYLYGTVGDYIAVRPDDDTDFYIIKRSIFEKTYSQSTQRFNIRSKVKGRKKSKYGSL